MPQRQILILGDSNTRAMKRALETRTTRTSGQEHVQFDIHWLLTKKGDRVRGELSMENALERASSLQLSDIIAIQLARTLHNIVGLLQHEQPYDIFVPGDETMTISEGMSVVPENALWDMFVSLAKDNKRVQQIRKAASCAVYHLATPPPKQDNKFIMDRAARYRERRVDAMGVAPAPLRLRLWKLEMRVLRYLCGEWGVEFVSAPQEALCPQGYLSPEYYADDATHANAAYGELVLKQLERIALQPMVVARAR